MNLVIVGLGFMRMWGHSHVMLDNPCMLLSRTNLHIGSYLLAFGNNATIFVSFFRFVYVKKY